MDKRDPSDEWTRFGEKVLAALDEWLARQPGLSLEHDGWLDGGRSGSRLALVVRRQGSNERRVVLRYCADGEAEAQRSCDAWGMSPDLFRRRHLVRPVGERFQSRNHWMLFQEVAGGDLARYTPLIDHLDSNTLAKDCQYIVKSTIQTWNEYPEGEAREPSRMVATTASDFLHELLADRLAPDASLITWMQQAGIDRADQHVCRGGAQLWNPFALLDKTDTAGTGKIQILRGHTHGDLNVRNILVSDDPDDQDTRFKLVDLGGFEKNGLLARDPMHLLLSIATCWVTPAFPLDPHTLIDAMLPRLGRRPEKAGRFSAVSRAVCTAADPWAQKLGIGDDSGPLRVWVMLA